MTPEEEEYALKQLREAKPSALADGFGLRGPQPEMYGSTSISEVKGIGPDIAALLPQRLQDGQPEDVQGGADEGGGTTPVTQELYLVIDGVLYTAEFWLTAAPVAV